MDHVQINVRFCVAEFEPLFRYVYALPPNLKPVIPEVLL